MNKKLIAAILFIVLINQLFASPKTISYQGVLTDINGTPKNSGSYEMIFSLYDVDIGGGHLWRSTKTVVVKQGIFSVVLGSDVPFGDALNFTVPYWLGIQIGVDAELTPRVALTASGYAIRSSVADFSLKASHAVNASLADEATHAANASLSDVATLANSVKESAVASPQILDGSIIRSDVIADFKAPYSDSSDYSKIADVALSVSGAAVAAGTITTSQISNGTILTEDIAPSFLAPEATHAAKADVAELANSVSGANITGDLNVDKVQAVSDNGLALVNKSGNGILVDNDGNVSVGGKTQPVLFQVVKNEGEAVSFVEVASFNGSPEKDAISSHGTLVRINNGSKAKNSAILRLCKYNSGGTSKNYGDIRLTQSGDLELATGKTSVDLEAPDFVVDHSGKVGIGTNTPAANLHVGNGTGVQEIRVDGQSSKFRIVSFSDGSNYIQSGTDWTAGSSADLHFTSVSNTQQNLTIKANGDIGVGTNAPSAKLEVAGDLKVTGNIISEGTLNGSSKIKTVTTADPNTTYYLPLVQSDDIVDYYIRSSTASYHTTMKLTISTTYADGTLAGQVTQYGTSGTSSAIKGITVWYGSTYDRACIAIDMGPARSGQIHTVTVVADSPFFPINDITLVKEKPTTTQLTAKKSLDISKLTGTFEITW